MREKWFSNGCCSEIFNLFCFVIKNIIENKYEIKIKINPENVKSIFIILNITFVNFVKWFKIKKRLNYYLYKKWSQG